MRKLLVLVILTMVSATMGNALNVINEDIKLLASDASEGSQFGFSIAIHGNFAVVGARADNEAGFGAGAAYIFRRKGGIWVEQTKLLASDPMSVDMFGWSVGISGNYAVVGAPAPLPFGGSGLGKAYVFHRHQGGQDQWGQQAQLIASDRFFGDGYAIQVDMDGNRVVVGVFQPFTGSGAAYVFKRTGGTWMEETKLAADDGQFDDSFGWSVAIHEDTIVVGAPREIAFFGGGTGAAYVFIRDEEETGWLQQAKLLASDGVDFDQFGFSVSISEDNVLVGSLFGDVGDLVDAGSAYVFVRDNEEAVWTEEAKLIASDASENAALGIMVSLSEDTAVISAMSHEAGMWTGSAYIFERDLGGSGNWVQLAKLLASDGQAFDEFGVGLAIKENTIMVGAPYTDDAGQYSGSIYIFSDWQVDDDDEDEDDDRAAPALASASMDFELGSNYPNPFNPETWIPYRLGIDADVVIRISDASGRLVRALELGHKAAGAYTDLAKAAYWDGRNEAGEQVSSGVYFYTIQAGEFTATKKMVVAN